MRTMVIMLVLVVLATLPAMASDVGVSAQKIQVQGMVGTIGAAAGIYWPVIQVPKYDIKLGPMGAIGENTIVAGGGVQIPVAIDAPILENLNFGWIGYGFDWESDDWGWEGGVGLVVEIK